MADGVLQMDPKTRGRLNSGLAIQAIGYVHTERVRRILFHESDLDDLTQDRPKMSVTSEQGPSARSPKFLKLHVQNIGQISCTHCFPGCITVAVVHRI